MKLEIESFLQEISDLPEFLGICPVDINTRSNFGNTPLHVAAIRGNSAIITALLDAGADANASGEHRYTPLHEAIEQGHFDAVQELLARGASLGAVTDDDLTPLALAQLMQDREIENLLRDKSS